MAINTLNLCSVGPAVDRDGQTGPYAHFILPFFNESNGIWFANGQRATFPQGNIPQSNALTLGGNKKNGIYKKDCCSCLGAF